MFQTIEDIETLEALEDRILKVRFANGIVKTYDVKPLFELFPKFAKLEDLQLFHKARVGEDGYGVVWDDELELSCDELWEHGEPLSESIDRLEYERGILVDTENYRAGKLKTYSLSEVGEMLGLDD